MPGIRMRDGDNIDKALRALKRQVERSGMKQDLKKKESYDKPSVMKKKKTAAAIKRRRKQERKMGMEKVPSAT